MRIVALARAKVWSLINWRRAYYMVLAESFLYLVLLGAGLSGMIGSIRVQGHDIAYLEFLFAGLVAMQTFRVFSYTLFTCSNDLKWGMYRLYILSGSTPLEYALARGLNACVHMLGQWLVLVAGGTVLMGPHMILKGLTLLVAAIPGVLLWAFLGVSIGTRIQDYGTRDLVSSVVVMPVVFSSSALYDMSRAPLFLKAISRLNPLSYTADSMRLLYTGQWLAVLPFLAVLITCTVGVLAVANYLLPQRNLISGQRG